MPNRNCPVCDSKSLKLIEEIELKTYDHHPMDENYKLSMCNFCGFIFCNTSVTQDVLDEYYTNHSKYDNKDIVSVGAGGLTDLDKMRLHDTACVLSQYIRDQKSSILDIGCASGGLIESLAKLGYINLTGLDPSPICIERVSLRNNCNTILGSILDDNLIIPEKFDFIILTHVLEHILDVKKLIKKLYYLLNENGIIYIECPDSSKYHINVHAPFQEFNTEHINHFTEYSFKNLSATMQIDLIETGSRTFKIENGEDYFACYGVFNKRINSTNNIFFEPTQKEIHEYILKSSLQLQVISNFIQNLRYQKIVLYGIGQFSYKIIKMIDPSKQVFYVDGDPRNSDKTIFGNRILSPNVLPDLCDDNTCIVITSLISAKEIKKNIDNIFSKSNSLTPKLYDFNQHSVNGIN